MSIFIPITFSANSGQFTAIRHSNDPASSYRSYQFNQRHILRFDNPAYETSVFAKRVGLANFQHIHNTRRGNDGNKLALQSRVNGQTRQNSNTNDMIFDIATIVSVLSEGLTLRPGDLIATGTPEGVGFAMDPPGLLQVGDVVECEVENIGVLRNHVVAPE